MAFGAGRDFGQNLQPNQACPVCGSLEHPTLAQWQNGLQPVGKHDIEQAKRQYKQADQAWLQVSKQVSNPTTQLNGLNEQVNNQAKKLGESVKLPMVEHQQQLNRLTEQRKQAQQHQHQARTKAELDNQAA